MEFGKLYIIATPIGNLGDISKRAIELLSTIEYIACEDTRKTGTMLKALGIERKSMLISYYEQSEQIKIPTILNLLLNGKDVALVSDSGTPGISDPGFRLVRSAIESNIEVISIPGATAVVSALVSSGLPTDKFIYLGFLPQKEGHRIRLLNELKESNKNLEATVILYEAPHKLLKTLDSLEEVYGDIQLVLMRELTKIHEERIGMKISLLKERYKKINPKGEYVILFNPKDLSSRNLAVNFK